MIPFLIGAIILMAFNLGMMTYYWLLIRRQRQLDFLLRKICIDAFLNRHLPIWSLWSDAFDQSFRIVVQHKDEAR
jgi:hypothetical protein